MQPCQLSMQPSCELADVIVWFSLACVCCTLSEPDPPPEPAHIYTGGCCSSPWCGWSPVLTLTSRYYGLAWLVYTHSNSHWWVLQSHDPWTVVKILPCHYYVHWHHPTKNGKDTLSPPGRNWSLNAPLLTLGWRCRELLPAQWGQESPHTWPSLITVWWGWRLRYPHVAVFFSLVLLGWQSCYFLTFSVLLG